MKVILILLFVSGYYLFTSRSGFHLGTMDPLLGAFVFIFIPLVGIPSLVHVIGSVIERYFKFMKVEQEIKASGFNITEKIKLYDQAIYLDGNAVKICVAEFSEGSSKLSFYFYDSTSLLSSKIILDDHDEVASASTGSVVGRAVVGGILFGGAGAIIGGVTAKTTSSKKIKNVQLRLIVDSSDMPGHRIKFYNYLKGTSASSVIIQDVMKKVGKWQVIMELVMLGQKIPAFKSMEQLEDHVDYVRLKAEREKNDKK